MIQNIVFTSSFFRLFFYSFFFVLGLGLGSFLNVLVLRFKPREGFSIWQSLKGRSHCPHCGKRLEWFELIPLLSFFIQKGKCRQCGASLSWQYPIVEFLTGLIFFSVAWHWLNIYGSFHLSKVLFLSLFWDFYFFVLLALALIDLRNYVVPQSLLDLLFFPALFLNLFYSFGFLKPRESFLGYYVNLFPRTNIYFLDSLIGMIIFAGFLWLLVKITKERGIGMGDAKIFMVLSLIFPWPEIFFVFLFSFLLGGFYSVLAMLFFRKTMKSKLPFAPFIVLAAILVFFFAYPLLNLYFSLW